MLILVVVKQIRIYLRILKTAVKLFQNVSELSKSQCSGSAINSEGKGFINRCEQGFWFWEDDCIDNDSSDGGCSVELPTVLDVNGNRKLKYSRNFTDNDYAQVCDWAKVSETNFAIKSMRQREPVMGRPKNPDGIDTSSHPVWLNGENMCNASGLEKLYGSNFKGIEELKLDCEKRNKDSCEKSEGDSSLYPTKTGSLCYWVDKSTDYADRGCWPYRFMCEQLTSKEKL